MDTDIRDEIDRSFGDGPAHPPLEQQLAAGRGAVRRRRGVAAVAACAAVAVLGASYALATSGTSPDTRGVVATDPTTPPTSAEPVWEDDTPIRYVDGELQIRAGVVVHEHVENPYGYAPPRTSDGLDLTYEGQRQWILAELKGGGFGYSSSVPSNGWADFDAWLADQVDGAVPGDDGWPATVELAADGRVVAAPGAEIVQRTDDPRLGDSFASARTPTGAAVVTVQGETRSYFVVWRVIDGKLDVITTPPRDVVGATFDELLTYARAQYASGEGLR
ncbi:hypothetical protein [Nocardioides mangrovi]|uniref:Uncharacterized protein n=1 Tax=Nocardioides mangrovi TaxID=2874580 RepID=A0ABS7UC04_9ACTN|nr:hypothetical protein [Nocardioides mangrovi]MBZ5738317.1 hypothetical protein [Nocardioides mangrovi]